MIINKPRILPLVIFLLAMAISVAGCTKIIPATSLPAGTNTPALAGSGNTAAILEKAAQSVKAATSYQLQRIVSVNTEIENSGSQQATSNINSQMTLGLNIHKMKMDNIIQVEDGTQTALPIMENSLYLIDNTLYLKGIFPEEPELWSKTSVGEPYWQAQHQANLLVKLAQSSKVSALAPENVLAGERSVPCDVLEVTPDLAELWDLLVGQPGVQLPSGAPRGVTFDEIIRGAQMRLWLSQTDGLPVKSILNIAVRVTPAQVPSLTSEVSMDFNLNMLFSAYNQAVTIELPEEAKDAEELSLQVG